MRLHNHLDFWLKFLSGKYPYYRQTLTANEKSRVELYCSPKTWNLHDGKPANRIIKNIGSGYRYDWYKIFNRRDERICDAKFGDVTEEFDQPTFTKSRPITFLNNNILLPLHSTRHLKFIDDSQSFFFKKMQLFSGAHATNHIEKRFIELAKNIRLINAEDTSANIGTNTWGRPLNFLPIRKQLNYKFIFCIEGNDVASNLKWVMGSNSIPVMPKPKYETWFCESKLIAGMHYIEVKDDFSNTEEVIEDYINKPKLCEEISEEGKIYAAEYLQTERQFSIAIEVIERYFANIKTL